MMRSPRRTNGRVTQGISDTKDHWVAVAWEPSLDGKGIEIPTGFVGHDSKRYNY